jgi:carboxymethylenebutenolidase
LQAQPAPWLNLVSRTSSRIVSAIGPRIRPGVRSRLSLAVREERPTIDAPGGPMESYLAAPDGWPPGPAIVVVQEWWGVNENIRDICGRLASEGYAALGPDLYHGKQTDEPDEARKLAMELDRDAALDDLEPALNWLVDRGADGVGAIGFCLGGALVWWLAHLDDRILAAVPFYGIGQVGDRELKAPLMAHFGGADQSITAQQIEEATARLEGQRFAHQVFVYEGAPHAFFNATRPSYRESAARLAWERTLGFLRNELGGGVG